MTVEEVAGLPTCKYTQRVHELNLPEDDLAFLKMLRRRIKNRLASQNSRRRSVEHLRQLARELRAVRACRTDALSERRSLVHTRTELRNSFAKLRSHVTKVLQDRSDPTTVPDMEPERLHESHNHNHNQNHNNNQNHNHNQNHMKTATPKPIDRQIDKNIFDNQLEKNVFECRIDKLVQQSVTHMFKDKEKRICAKTVFIDKVGDVQRREGADGVLNLCVKERRSHGRKQPAPRRIAYYEHSEDVVLDLKIKKESQ
ncbi:probable basic-leucine zipper transcription factor E isoform X2 [Bicyclus anynana]|nr:probable basic-leucine zipper transcription factor E isoform X2 [Bicyclus anynana]XP_052746218.1 probable basic-leucine zipper transcription factor E isoform X2 [Bicyclus anynana]